MVRYHHHIRHDSRVEPDHLYNLVLWLIPVCILCARAYYVLFEWEQYKDMCITSITESPVQYKTELGF